MFRIYLFPGGQSTRAESIWANASRGGADAGRAEARGIRGLPGAYLIYDAS